MITIKSLDGKDLHINENAISMISGGAHTNIFTLDGPKHATAESPQALVNRLGVHFAKLTRPDGSPVWVKPSAVNVIREPISTEMQGNKVNAVIQVAPAFKQALREDVATASRMLS